jgi:CheY-like chemotaxis protein
LRTEPFDAVYADLHEETALERMRLLFRAEGILQALQDGVAVVDPELRILWANAAFEKWCGEPAQGRSFYEALGSPEILGPDYSPFHTALAGKTVTTRLHCRGNCYLQLQVTPVHDSTNKIDHFISLCQDITSAVQQQQMLDALHQAGRDLASLPTDQIAEMSIAERVELLKLKIRTYTRELLHYDVLEIRLLDRQTGLLEPLLEVGMSPEATQRVLYAKAEGSGVTGFVAATGQSYVCSDTRTDPLYIEGSPGARSSLTVPILFEDQVIGTFNVESPRTNAFGEEDQQFAEIFSREVANALHTLDLLTAEKRTTTSRSIEAISREVALPVDEILAAATAVLDRYLGHDPEMAGKLRQILASARSLKACIQKVGENLAPAPDTTCPKAPDHPRLKGQRLLVADNDERLRRSAHSLLGRFGCIVETARDGQEALTMARLSTYDAVLADIRLPDLSGYEVFHKLRQVQPLARVILMTAYGYDPSHSIVKARQEGLRYVLYKPFRVDQLLDALEGDEKQGTTSPSSAAAQPETVQAR